MTTNTADRVTPITPRSSPAWPRVVLKGAAIYNVGWGVSVVAFPGALFALAGMTPPAYPWLFQCIGMIVAVYGIGYWIAADNPRRYWPVVFVGLLGKTLGPIGFLWTAMAGEVSWRFGATILTNDLLWWVPFALILLEIYRQSGLDAPAAATNTVRPQDVMRQFRTRSGATLLELSKRSPILIVFLRHTGCTFCRETLADIRDRRSEIEAQGVRVVLVHMTDDRAGAEAVFHRYGLGDVDAVSDPDRRLYRAFGLAQGTLRQLFGLRVWWRGFRALLRGHGAGRLAGDGLQMPGAFVVHRGEILESYRHDTAADRPDYTGMACTLQAPRMAKDVQLHS